MLIHQLDSQQPQFPDVNSATEAPNGLLAVGGELNSSLLITAYQSGIFPWFDQGSPVLWWSPDPREVVRPGDQHWSKSMQKMLRQSEFSVTTDKDFKAVINACARQEDVNHWITDEMILAYSDLHKGKYAHSIEVWHKEDLVGGLYGVAVGSVFCGESMFHKANNASKLAFLALADTIFEAGFDLIDCQFETEHLRSLGSSCISRDHYMELLKNGLNKQIDWPDTFNQVLS